MTGRQPKGADSCDVVHSAKEPDVFVKAEALSWSNLEVWKHHSKINVGDKCERSQQLVAAVTGELCDLGGESLQESPPAGMERPLPLGCLSPAPSY